MYRELDAVREQVHEVDTMQAMDECMGHLLLTLNTVFAELGSAPLSTDPTELSLFTRQIARRLQAENRIVKDRIRNVLATDPNAIRVANALPALSANPYLLFVHLPGIKPLTDEDLQHILPHPSF